MSRRLDGKQPWAFWEVQAIASFFEVTLEELAGTLPNLGDYAVRHQGLEPRTRCFGGNSKPGPISGGGRGLRLLGGTNPAPALLRVVA